MLTTDCKEGNKKAMELILKMQEGRSIDPTLQYLVFFLERVNVGKSLKCSFGNWFIILIVHEPSSGKWLEIDFRCTPHGT